MDNKSYSKYIQKLIVHYIGDCQKSGLKWHDWVIHQVRAGTITITEAHDILCEVYRYDPLLTVYLGLASYYFYVRIKRPAMINRLMQRVGNQIAPYVVYP